MKESKRSAEMRTSSVEEQGRETPRLLSPEEKRELILAHARSQPARDPMQRWTVWGGVMIVLTVIGFGWWWTVGARIRQTPMSESSEFQALQDTLDRFTETVNEGSSALRNTPTPTNTAGASELSEMMKAVLEGKDQGVPRDDLMAPRLSGASASSTEDEPERNEQMPADTDTEEIRLIDPETPGLEPDSN